MALEDAEGICVGTYNGKKAEVAPDGARPKYSAFRRRDLLKLVEAIPSERYKQIQRFIDTAGFEASEDALRTADRKLAQDVEAAKERELHSLGSLNDIAAAAGKPEGDGLLAWVQSYISDDVAQRSERLAAVTGAIRAHDGLTAFVKRHAGADVNVASARAAHMLATDEEAGGSGDTAGLVGLLEHGRALLDGKADPEQCPLCESAENVGALRGRIEQRLADLEAERARAAKWRDISDALATTQAIRDNVEADYAAAVADLAKARAGLPTDLVQAGGTPPPIRQLGDWLAATDGEVKAWRAAEAKISEEGKVRAGLRLVLETYERSAKQVAALATLRPRVTQALAICVAERQAFVDGILGAIAQQVGQLYEAIHPGEGLDKIALPLDSKQRASIGLSARFDGAEAPPQAYFSQSHMDTLGLCVFLALALRERPEDRILILDDVLGSVDEPHVDRVIDLIYDVSDRFRHTVVTTHYRPWKAKFKWGELKPGKPCQFVELVNWSLANGMRAASSLPEVERLKAMIAAADLDIQGIAAKSGVILERVLDYLTLRYGCKVPRRHDDNYTLGDLLPNLPRKLRQALRVERRQADGSYRGEDLSPRFDALDTIYHARNLVGAHFNTLADHLSDADALKFAGEVVLLADAVICREAGWPNSDKSGSYWRTAGDTLRLHPLGMPG